MSNKPKIGISTYREMTTLGIWHEESASLPATYVDCVAEAGGIPLLLSPIDDTSVAVEVVEALDGLVISGGPDVDPARYDEPAHEKTDKPRVQRDAWELALLTAALERDIPVLGICRGVQLFNVHFGGSLIQHIEDHKVGNAVYKRTRVSLDSGSLPGSILGPEITVSCYHHQALGRIGDGLTVTGRAPDGTVEAVVASGRAFAVGVQWHPEEDRELRLFAALVESASKVTA